MGFLIRWFKSLFCKHKSFEFLGNIHGDLINQCSASKRINRSAYKCRKCGVLVFGTHLGDKKHETFNEYLRRTENK
jgi:hypothetical protein